MTDNDMTPDQHLPAIKADIREIRDRLDGHDQRFDSVDGNLRRLNLFAARTEGRLSGIDEKLDILLTMKDDFSRFQSGLDKMARQMESFDRWCRSQGSMLMEHEARIAKLESKPS
jgi:tetrahydromethanopterin S-methyltransferase subunit G